jgi:hypothetical protein
MSTTTEKGNYGVEVACSLWPGLEPVDGGSALDLQGCDAWLSRMRVQIKWDETIAKSGNIFHEHYEKSYEAQPWRVSPGIASIYIFVTIGEAHLIAVNELAVRECNKPMRELTVKGQKTSMGILIPLKEFAIIDSRTYHS